MKREDDEQLWDVLGRAPEPKVTPFFAHNVLRQIRQEPRWTIAIRSWFSLRRLVPASAVALALVAAIVSTHSPSLRQERASNELDPVAKIDAQDYEVVADLDDLLASDENSLWDDNSSL
ncbi:MAG: hypothetical protein M3R29_02220 [Verrucomicrobiota bacterium]|nr:hypothetical protein [Verrucomicrobiota bacterium]